MNRELGRFGEAWAAGLLSRKGFRVVDRNVRFRVGEIDLIAYDGDQLVFVEVKCRRTSAFGRPEESVTRTRFTHLAGAIQRYLQEHRLEPPSYRVDVVAIEVNRQGAVERFEHLRGVEAPR